MYCMSKAALLVHGFFHKLGFSANFFYLLLILQEGEGGAQRPVSRVNEPKNTGTRSASAAKNQ
jgi:hypothetical protein